MNMKIPCYNSATTTAEEAAKRLDAILSDRLLWFNPYRVADRVLLDCAERGRWSPFPALTQMMVFHFKEIREIPAQRGYSSYRGIVFNIGCHNGETHVNVNSLIYPMTHIVTRQPVWTLINDRHLVRSNVECLVGKNMFISHAVNCCRINGMTRQAYRMYRLFGNEARRATTIRKSMCAAKIIMLNEVLHSPTHPDYLGNPCNSFDYAGPIRHAIAAISRFPDVTPPATHIIG